MKSLQPVFLIWLALASALFLPGLFTRGEFLDGLVYASISRNLSEGLGSYWLPYYTSALYPVFTEHPPFFFWLEAFWFRLLGDHHFTERLFSLLCFALSVALIHRIAGRIHRGTSWFTAILWTSIPVVFWAFRNNLLEVVLTPLILGAYLVWQQRYTTVVKAVQLPLVAVLFMAAFLTKGPVALGTLVLPLCFLGKTPWKKVALDVCIATLTSALLLFALLQLSEGATHHLGRWFNDQFIGTLAGHRASEHATSRFQLLFDFVQQMAIPAGLALLVWVLSGVRPRMRQAEQSLLWAALLFSLPMLLSPKQHYYYLLPALAFAVLYLGSASHTPLQVLREKMTWPVIRKVIAILCVPVVTGSLVYATLWAGTYHRDAVMQRDLAAIAGVVPGDEVGVEQALKFNWSLHAYAMRDHRLSLVEGQGSVWLIAEGGTLPGYQRITPSTERFHLFQRDTRKDL